MSAIGDYIHLNAKNYNKYGINRYGEENREQYNFEKQKENINIRLQASKIKNQKQLEKALENILSTEDTSENNAAIIRNEIERILNERFAETMGKINWNTGNITANLQRAKNVTIKSIEMDSKQQSIELKSIMTRVRAIEQARNSITNQEEQSKLTAKINQIYKELNLILTGAQRGMITELKNTSINKLKNQRIDLNSNTQNLITTINSILKTYAAVPAINLQKGDLFEYAIALAPAVAKINVGENIDEYMKQLEKQVSGGDRSRVVIDFDKNNFTEHLNLKQLEMKGYVVSESTKTAYSYGTSQEKIDVNLQWEGENLAISAKNVNLQSPMGVHILSGSSLLYLLQDENEDFVNHYFNIIATHEDHENINADIEGAHEAMRYTLLFKALTGQTFGRTGATLFLVNDNTRNGGVHIFDIKGLINKASDNLEPFTNITANGQDIASIQINNIRKKTYSDRITAYLAEVHKQKISATLKPALLN